MNNMHAGAIAFLYRELGIKNVNATEKRYRFEHSLRVANIAGNIAKAEGQNILTATLAAILHDIGKYDTQIKEEHGRVSAEIARPFLMTLDISERQIQNIQYCIAAHVNGDAGYDYEDIAEAKTVIDADAIDRFGIYRILQSMDFGEIETVEKAEILKKCKLGALTNFKTILSTDTANIIFESSLNALISSYHSLI